MTDDVMYSLLDKLNEQMVTMALSMHKQSQARQQERGTSVVEHQVLHSFDGSNPQGWILHADKFFSLSNIPSSYQRIRQSSKKFELKAMLWFQWMSNSQRLSSWENFKIDLMANFGPSGVEESVDKNEFEGKKSMDDSESEPLPALGTPGMESLGALKVFDELLVSSQSVELYDELHNSTLEIETIENVIQLSDPLLIVVENGTDETLATLVVNKLAEPDFDSECAKLAERSVELPDGVAISAQFPKFSNKDKTLMFQFSVTHGQKLVGGGGGYMKLFSDDVNQKVWDPGRSGVTNCYISMAGGGGSTSKTDDMLSYPVKDQLPNVFHYITNSLPWQEAILLGFQQYLIRLRTVVNIHKALASQVAGLNTILQSFFETRLPAVSGNARIEFVVIC